MIYRMRSGGATGFGGGATGVVAAFVRSQLFFRTARSAAASDARAWHGQPQSIEITLPPLALVVFKPELAQDRTSPP